MPKRKSSRGLARVAASLAVGLVVGAGCGSVATTSQGSAGEPTTTLSLGEPTTSLAGEGLGDPLADELAIELSGRFLSIGKGTDAVEIVLAPDEEVLASELLNRYGNQVDLSVGRLKYPLSDASSVCPDAPERQSQPDLGIAVIEPGRPIRATGVQSLELSVRLTNVSESPIAFSSGAAVGTITDLSGKVVSSGATGGLALEEIPVELASDESEDLPLYASMASCDPELGYLLPPGEYLIIAEVVRIGGGIVRLHSAPQTFSIGT